jgi:hypothetical protein
VLVCGQAAALEMYSTVELSEEMGGTRGWLLLHMAGEMTGLYGSTVECIHVPKRGW